MTYNINFDGLVKNNIKINSNRSSIHPKRRLYASYSQNPHAPPQPSVVVPGAPGSPGAAAPVRIGPLVPVAVVVRPSTPIARHVVPPHGAVADVPSAAELPPRALGLHHHLLVEVEGVRHQIAVALGLRHRLGEIAGVCGGGHGGQRHQEDGQRKSGSHRRLDGKKPLNGKKNPLFDCFGFCINPSSIEHISTGRRNLYNVVAASRQGQRCRLSLSRTSSDELGKDMFYDFHE
ncbi:translation initiation factor IF-2 [Striga asiatica]|uniref:Translation initiation factor IF-2 n=1 Tax=Striga asiatica TaxID=4170 RepID=A0A5A7QDJ5_STRAF|nr:translation initiation factor IF-2 [Striga asiatica]